MARRKLGLHKKITAIFDGAPIPKKDGAELSGMPAPGGTSYVPPIPHARPVQTRPTPGPLQPTPAPEPQQPAPAPKPQPPAPAPKPPPPAWSLPKAVVPKRSKVNVIIRAFKKIIGQQVENKFFALKPGVSTTRQKIMAILIPVLFIILIFIIIRIFSAYSPKIAEPANFELINAAAGSNNEIDWQIPELYPAVLRDPMQFGSIAAAQEQTNELIVKGILHSEDNPAVVIGAEIMREGDEVLGATIVKINKDNVEFEKDGKRWMQKVSVKNSR